jgi:hypothetical protein
MAHSIMRHGLACGLFALLLASSAPAAAALETGPSAGPAQPRAASLFYRLYAAGMNPIEFTVDATLDPQSYSLAVQGHTNGVIDLFVRWTSHSVTEGRLVAGEPRPILTRSVNSFHGKPRRITIDYRSGQPVASVEPPPDEDDRDPVLPEQMRNTMDATSAVLNLIQRLALTQSCRGQERVFDGRRRFDLLVSDAGVQYLEQDSRSPYSGVSHVCDFRVDRIAGYNRRNSDRYEQQPKDAVYRTWSAEVLPGFPAVPIRLEGEGSLGTFRLYLVSAKAGARRPSMADLERTGR